ncbi:splicing factor, Prp19-binding domain-containing protein [Lipomyces tetrasporus]|uniref:Splicing factor, Prp19-binding domain-containing protein n=1 Tax=Lipomyces tetrasporus TaxID=54092 RepID=A0AAD7VRA1_9ASCO|nr:splicing factor, Prp19-binding domain-containing protein [Lipomyces tetrasporus]KAJ8098454.1 splicing factor, Prp19-binding domain-containing protein [Lipomyces tetrasporus]
MPPKLSQPIKRTRYFPGKRTSRSPSPSSSSDESGSPDEDESRLAKTEDVTESILEIGVGASEAESSGNESETQTSARTQAVSGTKPVVQSLKKVDLNERFREKTVKEEPAKSEEEQSEDESESEEESESGSEDESESEEEKKVLLRPMFVPRNKRATSEGKPQFAYDTTADDEVRRGKKKEETLAMIEQQIRAEAAAHAISSLHEANIITNAEDIDDTDDLDPLAERATWKLRELKRIKRERDELEQRERELQEIELRRNMDENERLKEDLQRVRQQQEEKIKNRGKIGFMQKYYHKGAFYQDLDILKRTDYSAGTLEDDVKDKTSLPKIMQVRGDQFGKRGQSKWTHLLNEDTSQNTDSPWFRKDRISKRAQDKLGGLHDAYPSKRQK